MFRTFAAAIALCAAFAAPAMAEMPTAQEMMDFNLKDTPCAKPMSALTLQEKEDCENTIKIYDGLYRTFKELKDKQEADADARKKALAREAEHSIKGVQVCGPDHLVKGHWEPSCK